MRVTASVQLVPKKFSHPRRYVLSVAMPPLSDCPHPRGVSSRIFAATRFFDRFDRKTSLVPSSGLRRGLNPTKCRSSGRATALLPWFTLRRKCFSMNRTTLAITR